MVAGGLSTLLTAPMDMVKTRLMLQRESKRVGTYKNGFHCAYQVVVFISCSFFHCTFFFFLLVFHSFLFVLVLSLNRGN